MRNHKTCLALIAAVFAASRIIYWRIGVRFDIVPLTFYQQYIDPALLKHDLWRSIFYLEQQPPTFNAYLGAILHLAPNRPGAAFHFSFLCVGLGLSISLFVLMERLGVNRLVALSIALVFTLSPSTVLYENLLFYEYPLTALLCIAALFLHRYSTERRFFDGLVFFGLLALIASIRVIYHLAWFGAMAALVGLALPKWRKQSTLAAAIPAIFLVTYYAKHFVLFHNVVPGGAIYQGINMSITTSNRLPPGALDPLIKTGKISPVLTMKMAGIIEGIGSKDPENTLLASIVPLPPKTGVPVLDECLKSNGKPNVNCRWFSKVAKLLMKDSLVVLRFYPKTYLASVGRNIHRYLVPDTDNWPFDGRGRDIPKLLSRWLGLYNLLIAGRWPSAAWNQWSQPWFFFLALPSLIGFGILNVVPRMAGCPEGQPGDRS